MSYSSYTKGDYLLFLFEIMMPKLIFDEKSNAVKLMENNVDFLIHARFKDNLLAVKVKLDIEDEKYRKPLTALATKQVEEAVDLAKKYLLMQSILQEQDR